MEKRRSRVSRKTTETQIELSLSLEGEGQADVSTGIPFLDHMLTLFARHGWFNLMVKAQGDLEVDGHHTVEDIGLCLGEALKKALGDKRGIRRYGSAVLPMDETLVLVAVDLSGRPYLSLDLPLETEKIGSFETELVGEFLRAFSTKGEFNLHVKTLSGGNSHHLVEALFKGMSRALADACAPEPRSAGIPSTKGVL